MGKALLEPGCVYHICSHAVGGDRLFLSEDNYYYFLRRYEHFIPSVADTYAYCLMSNHLHILIELKNEIDIPHSSKYTSSQFASKQFSNLFSSYAQAFNKQQRRMGNLFISNFKRRKVDTVEYLTNVIKYIHFNPVNHGFVKHISQWKFSSFNTLCSDNETFLAKGKVLGGFGGLERFKLAHEVASNLPPETETFPKV